jgi:hypothetical protein
MYYLRYVNLQNPPIMFVECSAVTGEHMYSIMFYLIYYYVEESIHCILFIVSLSLGAK